MKATTALLLGAWTLVALGCGASPEPVSEQVAEQAPIEADPLPALLDLPFTADQIREEWIEGFQIRVRSWSEDAETFERWTVVGADADGVEIESVEVDENGSPVGEAGVQRSSWVQLRDHASFPADRGRRERVTRATPLGEFEGWFYTVHDADGRTTNEFFFADDLPGAPVFVHLVHDGVPVEIFEQIERFRP